MAFMILAQVVTVRKKARALPSGIKSAVTSKRRTRIIIYLVRHRQSAILAGTYHVALQDPL